MLQGAGHQPVAERLPLAPPTGPPAGLGDHRLDVLTPGPAADLPSVMTKRALLLEGARYSDLTLFDCVSGGQWERGLFAQIREKHEVFERLPAYAHEALVTSHLRNGSHIGYRPGVLETYLAPWLGEVGQAAFYRQYRQLAQTDTDGYEHLLADIDIPVRLLSGARRPNPAATVRRMAARSRPAPVHAMDR